MHPLSALARASSHQREQRVDQARRRRAIVGHPRSTFMEKTSVQEKGQTDSTVLAHLIYGAGASDIFNSFFVSHSDEDEKNSEKKND
jgi:hypothetical protein